MKLLKNLFPLLTACASLMLFTGTAQADNHKETGTVIWVQTSSESAELPSGLTAKRMINGGISLADDPESVFHNAKQISAGTDIYDEDGEWVGSYGYGEIRDSDGDLAFYSYSNTPDTDAVWTLLGGTGKFEGISGGGKSEPTHMADGRQVHKWKGSWKLKD
jgi:hypothetical protein